MKHAATRELFAYWNRLRRERSAPERSEIDPAAIRSVLADTFMLDVDTAQRFPFRLAGTRVNGLFDAEQKGHSFLDRWRAEERRNVAAVLLTVADGACPVVLGSEGVPSRSHDKCQFELLILPLRHFGKTHSRLLGIVTPAAPPSWLGLIPVGPFALRSLRIVEDGHGAAAWQPDRAQLAAPSFSDLSRSLDREPADPTFAVLSGSRPQLRVIEGGRSIR